MGVCIFAKGPPTSRQGFSVFFRLDRKPCRFVTGKNSGPPEKGGRCQADQNYSGRMLTVPDSETALIPSPARVTLAG